jgi:hypothetical protein
MLGAALAVVVDSFAKHDVSSPYLPEKAGRPFLVAQELPLAEHRRLLNPLCRNPQPILLEMGRPISLRLPANTELPNSK